MILVGPDLLLVLMGDAEPMELRGEIVRRVPAPRRVRVVAPALVGALDWLAPAEDDARRKAEVRVLDAEWTLAGQTEVEGEAAGTDPVQAVADALGAFPADEILIAGDAADADLDAALAVFGLPVRRLGRTPAPRRASSRRALRELAAGRRESTPFVLFLGVNGALLALCVVLSLLVTLVVWLLGRL